MNLWISSLTLSHFRNYDHLRLELSEQPIVLVGHNGAGKTNLLEAVSFLTPGRGLRRATISDVQLQGASQPWAVAARVHTPQGEVDIGTGRDPEAPLGEKRIVRIDGKNTRGQAELAKYMAVLWLTPQMDSLFLESDAEKRRFLDRLVYAFDPEHASRVGDYEQAMRERNRLLSGYPHPGPLPGREREAFKPSPLRGEGRVRGMADPHWLSALEQKMAELGVAIAAARRSMAHHLNEAIRRSEWSFPKARIALRGFAEDLLEEGMKALEIEDQAKARMEAARPLDAAAGRATFGIHRTSMQTWFDARDRLVESCSTGEQKALLLSILLGQAQAVKAWKGVAPILLLDEVVSHLDAARRAELCEALLTLGSQAWMTGTDLVFFEGLKSHARRFRIEGGKASEIA